MTSRKKEVVAKPKQSVGTKECPAPGTFYSKDFRPISQKKQVFSKLFRSSSFLGLKLTEFQSSVFQMKPQWSNYLLTLLLILPLILFLRD